MLKNKKILIVTDNLFIAARIMLSPIYKTLKENNKVEFHSTRIIDNPYYKTTYPNDIKYKDLPFISDIQYKLKKSEKDMKDFFSDFDILMLGINFQNVGCFNVYTELSLCLGKKPEDFFEDIYFLDVVNKDSISADLDIILKYDNYKNKNKIKFFNYVESGHIKRYFEYNYQMNLNILVKDVYKEIFFNKYENSQDFEDTYLKYGLSKYSLLTILSVLNNFNIKEEQLDIFKILYHMIVYKGSGKYSDKKYEWIGIGSPASNSQIVENLEHLKFFTFKDTKNIEFTQEAFAFKNLINKKLYDPDLPFRLHDWCELSFSEAKTKIDLYIKNCFEKQKIKNRFLKRIK